MNDEKYTGEERRTDSVSVRLALLERSYFENKDSNIAIHKRITEIRKGVAEEVKTGLESILAKLDKQQEKCAEHKAETATLENNIKWINRWLTGLTTAYTATVAAIAGFIFHKGKTG